MKQAALALLVLLVACKPKAVRLFEEVDGTGIAFTNNIQNTKDFNIFTYRNYYNGGGAAIGDVNNDGLADVFFTSNMGANKLYLNKGSWKFEDVSAKAGIENAGRWNTGVVMVDLNADGWLDIYVCNAGYINGAAPESRLYINNKNGTFSDAAAAYGLQNKGGYATHAAFFDYDIDGDLDCFIINNSFIPVNTLNYANERGRRAKDWPVADFLKGGGDRFLRNDGGHFTDVSEQAGIYGSLISFGLGVTVGDVNGDFYPDVYVSNDFFERDYLYINQGNGRFRDELESRLQHTSLASMGADMGDINNDGKADIFTTDMLPDDDRRLKTTTTFDNVDVERLKANSGFYRQYMQNTLQVNTGNGTFTDAAFYTGVAASDWSWGGLMFDGDNDGNSDLYVCNGIYNDVTDQDFIEYFANDVIQKMVMSGRKEEIDNIIKRMPSHPVPNKLFRNSGGLRFTDASADWGLDKPSFSNGAAYGDLDNDGDLDLVVNNVNAPAFVYRNNTNVQQHRFAGFVLQGSGANTGAVGCTVRLYCGSEIITREQMPTRGFQSSVDYKMIIGVGNRRIDSAQIIWPDRTVTTLMAPATNTIHTISHAAAQRRPVVIDATIKQPVLRLLDSSFARHTEDDYVDFYTERGLPMPVSAEGPEAAVGDVNGDGKADLFICGAAGSGGRLYLQTAVGYAEKKDEVLNTAKAFEQTAAAMFDADGDGDNDLVVGAGGNHLQAGSFGLQCMMYLNDGRGNFSAGAPLPSNGLNCAVLAPHDVDGDGDIDLFAGSRSVPQQYGVAHGSNLLINNGKGIFADATTSLAPQLLTLGFVTDALWVNVAGGATKELVVVAEWSAPQVFSFEGGKTTALATGLEGHKGWWQSVTVTDADGDGDTDLVAGNWGENSYLKPMPDAPIKMWVADFDNNGSTEKIFTRTIGGRDVPVFLKKDLTEQIASLKKQNLKYNDFAGKAIQDLFAKDVMDKATKYEWTTGATCLFVNQGGGKFAVQKLPLPVQFSSVNAIAVADVNGDGREDLLAGGNTFGLQPQFARLDASYGHLLLNNGKGYTALSPTASGLMLRGAVRDIQVLPTASGPQYLFLQNNDVPKLYAPVAKRSNR